MSNHQHMPSFMLKALISDHSLLFRHVVTYESLFSKATSSSCDYFSEFPRWSLTRASTVACWTLGEDKLSATRLVYFSHIECTLAE